MKKTILKIASLCICMLIMCSVFSISVFAATTVRLDPKKTKVTLVLESSNYTTLVVYNLSCVEKHTETKDKKILTTNCSSGCEKKLTAFLKSNTGYKFVNSSKNTYKYSISSNVVGPVNYQIDS